MDVEELLSSVVVRLCQQIDVSLAVVGGWVTQTRRHQCSSEAVEVKVTPQAAFTLLIDWF